MRGVFSLSGLIICLYWFCCCSKHSLFAVAPVIAPFQFDGPQNTGSLVVLPCFVPTGDSPMKIKWYLNGKQIVHHLKGVNIASFGNQGSILNINSVESHHRGEYTCVAENAAGKAKYSAVLDVKGTILFCIVRFLFVFIFT